MGTNETQRKNLDGNYTTYHPSQKPSKTKKTCGHCWKSKDKLISDLLLWIPTHGHTSVDRPSRTNISVLCGHWMPSGGTAGDDDKNESMNSVLSVRLDDNGIKNSYRIRIIFKQIYEWNSNQVDLGVIGNERVIDTLYIWSLTIRCS